MYRNYPLLLTKTSKQTKQLQFILLLDYIEQVYRMQYDWNLYDFTTMKSRYTEAHCGMGLFKQ